VEHGIVQKDTVRVLAVVAEGFAVIRGNDDDGVAAGGLD